MTNEEKRSADYLVCMMNDLILQKISFQTVVSTLEAVLPELKKIAQIKTSIKDESLFTEIKNVDNGGHCGNCTSWNEDLDKYCWNCGRKIKWLEGQR